MKNYEMVTILDPGLDTTAFIEKSKFLEEKIKSHGGAIQNATPWGKRKLAYTINKKDAGYYVVMNFQITPEGLLSFKESIKHDTDILRYLIVIKRSPMMDAKPVGQKSELEQKITDEGVKEEIIEEGEEEK